MPILAEEGSALLLQVLKRMIDGTVCDLLVIWYFPRLKLVQQTDSIKQDPGLVTHASVIDSPFTLVDWWKQDAKKVDQVSRATSHQVRSLPLSNHRAPLTNE
jgi:methionyl-tRNA formyltransferase